MEKALSTSPQDDIADASPEQEIIHYISKFAPLTEAEIRGILDSLTCKVFKKNTLLLREGQVADLCHFVLKGCVRQYYLVDGVERTTNFFTEGEPVAPYEGDYQGKPAKFYLECLEDCILTVSPPGNQAALFDKFPQFEAINRMATEQEWGKTQERFATFLLNSPEERYLDLLKTRPDLLDRVPQYQLASFLGVTPESLSRIRRRIMLK
jgi:CRP-like cAMP-binding protein